MHRILSSTRLAPAGYGKTKKVLTDEDLKMIAALLDERGLKKTTDRKRSLNAERQRRHRERNAARNAKITRQRAKRNGERHAKVTDESPIVISIPLNDGTEYGVTEKIAVELGSLYPAVDVPQTLREIRGWSIANAENRKTYRGCMRFISGWLQREQNKG